MLTIAYILSGYFSLIISSLFYKALIVLKVFKSFDNFSLVLGNP